MSFARTDAPEELSRMVELCNSARLLATEDALITPTSSSAWLRSQDVPVEELGRRDHELLLRVRECLRDHVEGRDTTRELNKLARQLLGAPRWSSDGEPVLPPRRTGPLAGYLAGILGTAFTAGLTGERDRLKTCRNPDCRWVFYDRSPARNSEWCALEVCTARRTPRRHRSRHAGG
ncbi:CGNR zinc finger domain-containing protein [Saccharomonospora halophila]|uniref:CGNR zinc finger domain-containing protein n=1 Tax=Saccharomonospora halophila TaxID=129922 RepID=UPI0003653759|nr:CGNR zinc finger domain-containing protein [Saccharomonospora halophila]